MELVMQSSPQPTDKKKEGLSLKLRVDVIRESSEGLSQRALAVKFNCSKTQIQNILKEKDRLLQEWNEGGHQFAKRKRRQKHENVNNFVWEWFKEARAKGLPLSGPILQEKAREFAAFFNTEKFNASNGWLDSFKRRHNIVFREMLGEIEMDDADWRMRVSALCKEYSLRDMFCVSETGLFFRAIPDKRLGHNPACHDGELGSERFTLALCINALGEKEPPGVIYSEIQQTCMKWYVDDRSWMTPDIFSDWVMELNAKMKSQDRKILLFLDDTPCHPVMELSNISFVFLPNNHFQQLHRDLVRTFKMLYRRRMLKALVARANQTANTSQLASHIPVLDAFTWIKFAWTEIWPSVAQRLFSGFGISIPQAGASLEDDIATKLDNIAVETSCLGEVIGIDVELEPERNVVACYEAGNNWEREFLDIKWGADPQKGKAESEGRAMKRKTLPLDQALSTVTALKTLANKLGKSDRLMKALDIVEEEFENIIVSERCCNSSSCVR